MSFTMTRMFKRWVSLLICLFLPIMMISFLYHTNEILQKKIAHSLEPDQRLFSKSLPDDDTPSTLWQRLVLATPFYRVDRDVDEPMTSRMTSDEVMQSKVATKQTITTRAAIEMYPLPESEVTVGTAERNVITPLGDDVGKTVKPHTTIKKRPTRRSRHARRSNKNSLVKPQDLSQNVGVDIPVKSIEVVDKSDDKHMMSTSAPGVEIPSLVQGTEALESTNIHSANTIKGVAKVSENHDGPTFISPVVSSDTIKSAATTTPATIVVRSTSKTITEIAKHALDNNLVSDTSLDKSIPISDGEKSAELKIPPARPAPSTKRPVKSKKTENIVVEQVVINEEKLNATNSDSENEIVQKKTDSKLKIQEQMTERNDATVKPSSRKEETKRKRDPKSKARRKSHTKELKVNVPVTLPLKFNLNDSKSNSPVILASTNNAFLNFTDNWLEGVKRSGIRSGVTLVAEDHDAFNYLKNKTDIALNVVLNDVSESPEERLPFDSPAYKQLVNKRPSYILQLLSSGHDVLFSDVDIVWLKNPLPYFTNDSNDIWLQEDLHGEPAVYCAGFTFYRSTPATIALVKEWVKTLASHPTYPDQRVLNGLLRKKRWQGDNLKRAVMDSRLFPSGHVYFDPEWREANKDIEQVMVHNNWIVGYDRKVERFKNEGLWYLDDKETKQISE